MSKNRGKSKLSKNVLFNANKHDFIVKNHWEPYFTGNPHIYRRFVDLGTSWRRVVTFTPSRTLARGKDPGYG
jgi:hypothetical protein